MRAGRRAKVIAGPPFLLRVAGVRAAGSGYPNAQQTIAVLSARGVASVVDLGKTLPAGLHLWRLRDASRVRKIWLMLQLWVANTVSLVRVLLDVRNRSAPVYVPYPAIFFLWVMSWLPGRLQPLCVADAYLSLWDSAFNDRSRAAKGGGTLARRLESRALKAASFVLVDTEANRRFYIAHLGLEPERVISLPLAVQDAAFVSRRAQRPAAPTLRVVFIGTMIPLHGVETILEAAHLLRRRDDIEFRLVGDGQMAHSIERAIDTGELPNLSWRREWVSLDALAEEMAQAHICLGVFGGSAKASRVLPFKMYYALALGRPIVTQSQMSAPEGVPPPPAFIIQAPQPRLLADAIEILSADPEQRDRLAAESAEYYDRWLCGREVAEKWRALLGAISDQGPLL